MSGIWSITFNGLEFRKGERHGANKPSQKLTQFSIIQTGVGHVPEDFSSVYPHHRPIPLIHLKRNISVNQPVCLSNTCRCCGGWGACTEVRRNLPKPCLVTYIKFKKALYSNYFLPAGAAASCSITFLKIFKLCCECSLINPSICSAVNFVNFGSISKSWIQVILTPSPVS